MKEQGYFGEHVSGLPSYNWKKKSQNFCYSRQEALQLNFIYFLILTEKLPHCWQLRMYPLMCNFSNATFQVHQGL